MDEKKIFTCPVKDAVSGDEFSAVVVVTPSEKYLADIYITPVSGQFHYYASKANWKQKPGSFNVVTKEKSGPSHNHFMLEDRGGLGILIRRDQYRRELDRRPCSIWDLGPHFAQAVLGHIGQ